jgi:hypothetical protein
VAENERFFKATHCWPLSADGHNRPHDQIPGGRRPETSASQAEALAGSSESVESCVRISRKARVEHHRGAIRALRSRGKAGSPVAVETLGNWYWIVGEIEEAEMVPRLGHAHRAKMMPAIVDKTDCLDAQGMNRLLIDSIAVAVCRRRGSPQGCGATNGDYFVGAWYDGDAKTSEKRSKRDG